MPTMKKIFMYVVMLIVIILVVRIYVCFLTKTNYERFNNYEILTESPEIKVNECMVAKNKGYINGSVKNTTDEILKDVNIKFDFYNENGTRIGVEYEPIEVFNVDERVKYNIEFEYKDVAKIEISILDK